MGCLACTSLCIYCAVSLTSPWVCHSCGAVAVTQPCAAVLTCVLACFSVLQIFWVSFLSSMANKKQDTTKFKLDPALAQKEM